MPAGLSCVNTSRIGAVLATGVDRLEHEQECRRLGGEQPLLEFADLLHHIGEVLAGGLLGPSELLAGIVVGEPKSGRHSTRRDDIDPHRE